MVPRLQAHFEEIVCDTRVESLQANGCILAFQNSIFSSAPVVHQTKIVILAARGYTLDGREILYNFANFR